MSLGQRYGPWALIAGASDGVGAAFARLVAQAGISPILIARRIAPLTELAQDIQAQYDVECVVAALDLSLPDAMDGIKSAVGGREIGLLIYNAGADSNGQRFLDVALDPWLALSRRNTEMVMRCCHHFGDAMKARGRGGMILVNSAAAYHGGSYLAAYSATKAFGLCFGESLWAELRPHGVDVLNLVLGLTDTPALRALLASKGIPPLPGMASPIEVAEAGLGHLRDGPTFDWAERDGGLPATSIPSAQRRDRILAADEANKAVFGDA